MPQTQPSPIRIAAPNATPSNAASFIFLHGYGDDAHGWTDIASQFHTAQKLPHLTWVFPTAPYVPSLGTTAWFNPGDFSALPVGRSTNRASNRDASDREEGEEGEEDEEDEEDRDGILQGLEYLCELVDGEMQRGVRLERIIVGGFSQGCILALLAGVAGRYAGRVGGVAGLSGALCSAATIRKAAREVVKDEVERDDGDGLASGKGGSRTQFFLAHGTKDFLIPMRFCRKTKERLEKVLSAGGPAWEGRLECHEYEGMGHVTCGQEFLDLCIFLERVVPE